MQFARQPQIEVREVDQDGCIRLAPRGFRHQMLEAPADSGRCVNTSTSPTTATSLAWTSSSAPDARIFSPPMPKKVEPEQDWRKRLDQLRAVGITRGFTGGEEELHAFINPEPKQGNPIGARISPQIRGAVVQQHHGPDTGAQPSLSTGAMYLHLDSRKAAGNPCGTIVSNKKSRASD